MVAVRGYRVLIVEDEYLLARDLGRYFTSMGAVVLGPVASIAAAQEQVEQADAAVLDVDINGQKVFPIADRLADRGVPFVFFTGRDDIAIPLRFRNTGYLSKPSSQRAVFDALLPFGTSIFTADPPIDTVFATLPKLRLAARLLMEDASVADRLVERTLEQALASLHTRERHADVEDWLTSLLEDTYRRSGRDLLN